MQENVSMAESGYIRMRLASASVGSGMPIEGPCFSIPVRYSRPSRGAIAYISTFASPSLGSMRRIEAEGEPVRL